jgi:hypothetical protein
MWHSQPDDSFVGRKAAYNTRFRTAREPCENEAVSSVTEMSEIREEKVKVRFGDVPQI